VFGVQPAANKTQETEFLRYGGKEQTYFPQYSYQPILGKYISQLDIFDLELNFPHRSLTPFNRAVIYNIKFAQPIKKFFAL
jgi:hypothetical protein